MSGINVFFQFQLNKEACDFLGLPTVSFLVSRIIDVVDYRQFLLVYPC